MVSILRLERTNAHPLTERALKPNLVRWAAALAVAVATGGSLSAADAIAANWTRRSSAAGDLDGDGRVDIVVKPYHHRAPRIDRLLQPSR